MEAYRYFVMGFLGLKYIDACVLGFLGLDFKVLKNKNNKKHVLDNSKDNANNCNLLESLIMLAISVIFLISNYTNISSQIQFQMVLEFL